MDCSSSPNSLPRCYRGASWGMLPKWAMKPSCGRCFQHATIGWEKCVWSYMQWSAMRLTGVSFADVAGEDDGADVCSPRRPQSSRVPAFRNTWFAEHWHRSPLNTCSWYPLPTSSWPLVACAWLAAMLRCVAVIWLAFMHGCIFCQLMLPWWSACYLLMCCGNHVEDFMCSGTDFPTAIWSNSRINFASSYNPLQYEIKLLQFESKHVN